MGKYCKNCGKELSEYSMFCIDCGIKVEEEIPVTEPVKDDVIIENNQVNEPNQNNNTNTTEVQKTNGTAIAGFVCSIVGIFFAGLIMGILGISLGVTARKHIQVFENEKGKGLATAAIIIGIIDIGFVILGTIFTVFMALAFGY